MERESLLASLARNLGSRSRTAKELGLSRRTLLYMIAEYGIKG